MRHVLLQHFWMLLRRRSHVRICYSCGHEQTAGDTDLSIVRASVGPAARAGLHPYFVIKPTSEVLAYRLVSGPALVRRKRLFVGFPSFQRRAAERLSSWALRKTNNLQDDDRVGLGGSAERAARREQGRALRAGRHSLSRVVRLANSRSKVLWWVPVFCIVPELTARPTAGETRIPPQDRLERRAVCGRTRGSGQIHRGVVTNEAAIAHHE